MSVLSTSQADNIKDTLQTAIDRDANETIEISQRIWDYAELGYQEFKSSELLQQNAQMAGFSVKSGVADIPTAFVASYGSGSPVIGIMGEFDALPGLSQTVTHEREEHVEGGAGHACGHNLFAAGSWAAAKAIKEQIEGGTLSGTIRFYGTPAEEGGAGKVYMARAGLFEDVDVMLHWHPAGFNDASPRSTNANKGAKFRFHGIPAHAALSPEKGRSALDAVEAMNFMANLMREHVPEATRIHYVITNGGEAPNVVPEFAEVFYYIRHPDFQTVRELFDRLVLTAEAAAMGTETTMEYEVINGSYNILPNEALSRITYNNLIKVGGVSYNAEEQKFAENLYATLYKPNKPLGSQENVEPFIPSAGRASSDVGDVSWLVPTTGLTTACLIPGSYLHTWQAVAAGGSSIAHKGMLNAAKVLAMTAADLLQDPTLIAAAREEWEASRGEDFEYYPLLGEREPPLDYRK
ncbi:amidohydrolase [Coraliomargarita sp. SDUM461004]|uniref:Amidohydrolase n=1 Tax=Thalassobacterium sedimentorum TaxID=3041258 RepID=A0ABU1AMP3_9BACT|nr:amidohydrolase [Coraliomargarita sp. SDUM461004]MDQ8196063.1 amidohydrolase [Coraliomargarita sp. SDUM461004]